ncbi:MAG: QueT transporter family protein [Ruminococcaceae bacterium]|nr:QueT transporter family protein [Oscillospiraceae bacterium]
MHSKKIRSLTTGAMIAALYVVLTYVSHMFGLASGAIQVRLSEALTVLPYFTPAAIPGLFVGCILSNLLTGCAVWDIVFGSVATLIGAIAASILKNRSKWLAPIPNIISNSVIIPFILIYVYGLKEAYYIHLISVFLGETVSGGILGMILFFVLEKHKNYIFKK